MAERIPNSLTAADALGNRLRVEFIRQGDRFAHAIHGWDAVAWQPWLLSTEGTDQQDWPASPPLQQLSIETRPEGAVALLLGMAGKSHWSASVQPLAGQAGFLFEIACRVRVAIGPLHSSYRLADGLPTFTEAGRVNCGRGQLVVAPHSTSTISIVDGRCIALQPRNRATPPATISWHYTIRYEPLC